MKRFILAMLVLSTYLAAQGTGLDLYDYQLQVNAGLKIKSGRMGLITLKPAKNAKEESIFGYWLTNNTNAASVLLDVKDGAKSVLSVAAKDFAAKAKVSANGTKSVAVFTSGAGAAAVTVTVESDIAANTLMPLGRSVQVDVKVRAASGKNLTAVLTLHGDGFVQKVGANGVSNSRVEQGKPEFPLAIIVGANGTTVSTETGEQKTPGRPVKLTSASVASTGEDITVLSFTVTGTTVKSEEKMADQAKNVENGVTAKKERTELALLNSASKNNPFPGDTITYTITYHNIGTSAAQDIVISNPVPAKTVYVERSAAGDEAEITVDRRKVNPPQVGEVTGVNWKVKKKVAPGQEGTVSFKAVVQ